MSVIRFSKEEMEQLGGVLFYKIPVLEVRGGA